MTDKLERDVAEILEAFEEYKERTGTAPEKVQELKHGISKASHMHTLLRNNLCLDLVYNDNNQKLFYPKKCSNFNDTQKHV